MLSSSSHEVKNITGVTQPSLRSFSHTLNPSPSGKYTSKRYKSVFSLSILLNPLISALSITSYPLSHRSCDNCPLITSSSSNIFITAIIYFLSILLNNINHSLHISIYYIICPALLFHASEVSKKLLSDYEVVILYHYFCAAFQHI